MTLKTYIQMPFLCRVTAARTRHMKGSTIDMQNQNAVPPSHPKTDEKTSLNSRPVPIPNPRKM